MRVRLSSALLVLVLATPAAADGDINLYSSRHYDTDEALYTEFEEETGITVNRIEDEADKLIERMRSEGELSAADVLLTVDAGRIARADAAGLLQPMGSEIVSDVVPFSLRAENDTWTGITTRARIIFYNKDDVTDPPSSYADLADSKYKGVICTRSSSNVYMLGLLSSIIAHEGEEAAKSWAQGLLANLAREPEGGDTDQLRAVLSGECDIAVSNHYYYARGFRKEVTGLSDGLDRLGYVFPNQDSTGTHVNISGAGIAKYAPNRQNAQLFIEYLLTPRAQKMLADGNDEFPVAGAVAPSEAVQNMGAFKTDAIALSEFASLTDRAQEIYNEIGYK